jgi:hypothetical protein
VKYLAILKDSLREALDSKLLYFTLGVSVLIVLLVGSLTFRPVPLEQQVTRFTEFMNWAMSFHGQGKSPHYGIADFAQSNAGTEPWQGEYRFVYVQEFPDEKTAEKAKDNGTFFTVEQIRQQMGDMLHWVEKLDVRDVSTGNPLEYRYELTTHGSKIKDRREWVHEPALFFGAVPLPFFLHAPLATLVDFIVDKGIGTLGAGVMMLLSIIVTASFIPSMLAKGRIDLLLAKPVRRPTLLIYKFVGGMAFMFLNTVVIVVGLWFVLGLQTRMWLNGLLLCILVFTFQFAIFYAVSTLIGVLTRSAVIAILLCVVTWVILVGVGWTHRWVDARRPEKLQDNPADQANRLPSWVYPTVDAIHFVLPHYKDLDALTTKLIYHDMLDPDSPQRSQIDKHLRDFNWTESIAASSAFIGILVGLACWRFAVKDY